ncbi:hypothetical protein BU23DRAFT_636887 [Bimuria novae-zelandiae CBS 107.79]|uniref:Uncharacterized protein n=1 Tax=Bimuria novae-zelandiae CBS 107.79 TaxID=1447943 RepID=A0A6A5VXR4_9PLEO|nr:hypothetical protein BU23DRAFT_636887 [Bimuria novae-zelandiae CBS 107.79]
MSPCPESVNFVRALLTGALLWSLPKTHALADTDSITWGDDFVARVTRRRFNGFAVEQIFAAPLVYTGNDGIEYIYVATTQNNLYKLDAKTDCVDINLLIGITVTGIVDPDTEICPRKTSGRLNGRMWQHAVHTEDLSEVFGWPIPLEGLAFRNNPKRLFLSGNQHARPGALIISNYLYTGYASHCIMYNYTGAIIGFNKNTGKIVEAFATEGGPEPVSVPRGGLKATGNDVPGRSPPSSLEEAAVNARLMMTARSQSLISSCHTRRSPLDGADRDLGTTPLVLLPSDTFTCPNHRRIGVVTSKSGKTYWLNLDNLGGYQQGPNFGDDVIQVYIPVTQLKTHVFKLACDSSGNAGFTRVSDTPDLNNGLGTGAATVTTINDREGSGLLWITDVQGYGLRVYEAIPPANGGLLRSLRNFTISGVTKFSVRSLVMVESTITLGNEDGLTDFQISNLPTLPLSLAVGQRFSFNATASLTNVGAESDVVTIGLQNGMVVYSSQSMITLRATGSFSDPLLAIAPGLITFGVIAGQLPLQQPILIWNLGNSLLTLTNVSFSLVSPNGPWIIPNLTI